MKALPFHLLALRVLPSLEGPAPTDYNSLFARRATRAVLEESLGLSEEEQRVLSGLLGVAGGE